ncbi:hypothetical protein ABFX02_13G030300 [Erythranthe guttata]
MCSTIWLMRRLLLCQILDLYMMWCLAKMIGAKKNITDNTDASFYLNRSFAQGQNNRNMQ